MNRTPVVGEDVKREALQALRDAIAYGHPNWFTPEVARQLLDVINAAKAKGG